MRRLIFAPLLIALAVPAAAQNSDTTPVDIPPPADDGDGWAQGDDYGDDWSATEDGAIPPAAGADIWDDDPYAEQDETVLAVDGVIDMLLDLPIAGMEGLLPDRSMARDVRPGDTVRDVLVRNDPGAEEQLRGGARAATAVIGQMIQRFGGMLDGLDGLAEGFGSRRGD